MRLWFDVVVTFDRKGLRRRDKNRWKALDETNSTVSLRASQSTRRTHKFHQNIWIPGIPWFFHGFSLCFPGYFGFIIILGFSMKFIVFSWFFKKTKTITITHHIYLFGLFPGYSGLFPGYSGSFRVIFGFMEFRSL